MQKAYQDMSLLNLIQLDLECDAQMMNHVARRASLAQGLSYLSLMGRSFPESDYASVLKELKQSIRLGKTPGHYPISFGACNRALGISLQDTRKMALFIHARSLLSSAIRLNIIGPYESLKMMTELKDQVNELLAEASDESIQTSPLLDIYQGMHDQLYSRLFHS
jgi:urease accessory protein